MISGISFGSTYNVTNKTNIPESDTSKEKSGTTQHGYILTTPSYMDDEIEAFCANKGIKFTKVNKMEAAKSRVKEPEAPFVKVEIDAEKFKQFLDTQRATNIYHLGRNYDQGFKENAEKLLAQDEFPATTLSIKTPRHSLYTIDDVIDTVKNKGLEGLSDDKLVVSFEKQGEYDQYTYFAFSEAGVNKIPVYMDEDTYKFATAAGLTE